MSKHMKGSWESKKGMTVDVRNGNLSGAMRILDRRMKQEGVLREYRDHEFYEKPSVRKRRVQAENAARKRKLAFKANIDS